MITLYLHEKEKWSREEGCSVHIFRLTADTAGEGEVVTKFHHTGDRDQHQEAHGRQLRHIEAWAKQWGVRIGNREAWSLGSEERDDAKSLPD